MTVRADILAGRAVILVNIQDNIDQALKTIRSKVRVGLNNIAEIGGDLFRGGLAGSLAAIFPVKEFVSFQDSMLFLQTKLKDTGVDVRELEKLIRELGRTTSFTSREVAEAGAVLAQAGLGERIGPTLQPTLDLARSERIDLDTAGRILANVMASFSISSEQAAETASKLIVAARLGTTDVVDLGEALKYSITTFRQLGIPLDEALAMITQLSNVSMRASLAGTSLNAAFGNLSAKRDQLKELGVVITDFDLENPVSMFTKLSAALEPLTRQEQVATLSRLFNIRGGRGFGGIMIQDLEELQKLIGQIRNAGDEAREMAILMDSQLGGVGRRALSAFQEALISVGETTEGPLTKLGNNLQLIFQNIGNLAQANPRLTQTLLAIPPVALAAGAGFLLMSTAISKVLMLVGPLLSANALIFKSLGAIAGANIKVAKTLFDSGRARMISMGAISGPTIPVFKTVGAGVRGIESVFRSLSKVEAFDRLFLSPQPMAALLNMFPHVEAGFGKLMSKAGGLRAASSAAGRSGPMGLATTAITRPVIQTMNALEAAMQRKGFTMGIRNAFVFGFQNAANPIASIFEKTMKGATAKGFTGKAPFLSSFQIGMNSVLKLLPRLYSGLRAALRGIGSVDYIRILYRSLQGTWTAAKGLLSVVSKLRYAFTLPGLLLIVEGLILFGDKIPIVKDALEGLGRAFSNAFKNLGDMFRDTLPSLQLFSMGFRNIFSGDIEKGILQIKHSFIGLGETIKEGIWFTWSNFVKDIEPGALMIQNAVQGLIGIFDALVASIGASFGTVVKSGSIIVKSDGSLLELFQSIFSPENFKSFFTFIIQLIGEIGKGINSAIGTIAQALHAIKTAFVAIVRSLSRIPILKGGTPEALAELDENAALRRSLEVALKNMNREFGSIMTKEQSKMYHDTRRQLDALPYVNPFKDNVTQANNDLQKKIDEILNSVNTAIINSFGDRPGAKTAANDARSRLAGAAIADAIMSPLETLRPLTQGLTNFADTVIAELPRSTNRFRELFNKFDEENEGNIRKRLDAALASGDKNEQSAIRALLREIDSSFTLSAYIAEQKANTLALNKNTEAWLKNPMEEAKKLWEGMKKAFGAQVETPELKDAKAQAASMGQAIKAVVGDFESTRYRQLQFQGTKLDEKRNELLDEGNGELALIKGILAEGNKFA